jgi:signal transduction histidine kinase
MLLAVELGTPAGGNEMLNFKKARWNERTRILVLMLTVLVPAAALIAVSVLHLRSIQRDRAVEAAIQRDYQHVLKIAEKRINARAKEMTEDALRDFPSKNHPEELQDFLARHPEFAYAWMYDPSYGVHFVTQPSCSRQPAFRAESNEFGEMLDKWLPLEAKELVEKLGMLEKKEGQPYVFYNNWVGRNDHSEYQLFIEFRPQKVEAGDTAVGGFLIDTWYLRDEFFPRALASALPASESTNDHSNGPETIISVRTTRDHDQAPLAASGDWPAGTTPEVERNFENVFQGLVLGIKLRGTTIEEISQKFLRTSFVIVGALSILLAAGMYLMYRSVTREMALAKLKSDFVSNVSHELRTPLSLIRLYAETLELGRLPNRDRQHEYYETIRKESERLTALINNILDFSRIEAGRKEYEFRDTNLADLVRGTLESYRPQIEQNGFKFEQTIEDNLPPVRVDREAIARSLLNLVNNAVKYSSTEKYLGVALYRTNGSVKLQVADRGIGIPATEQHKIFEKFYRVGDPLVHNTKGSGLGLSLVRHIVQAHGGDVSVDSAPGKGSVFTISLPVQQTTTHEAKGARAS